MKTTKKIILLSITLFSIFSFNNVSEFDKTIIFYDDFNDNRYNWLLDTEFSKGSIDNSIYELTSLGNRSDIRVQNVDLINENRDFEVEASIRIVGESAYSNSIVWGSSSVGGHYKKGLSFGFNSHQKFIALQTKDWVAHDFFSWRKDSAIKRNEFNKLLVRKQSDHYHFYINNVLVETLSTKVFNGRNFGFHVANEATIQIDYFKVSIFLPRA